MKEVDFDGGNLSESVDFRFLDSASSSQIEAVCLYEYMRESQRLRDQLKGRGKSDQELQCPFYLNVMFARVLRNVRRLGRSTLQSPFLPNLTLSQLGVLFVALGKADFPRRWVRLNDASKTQLVSLFGGLSKRRLRRDKETYPPVIIEETAAEFDPLENCWRVVQLEPSELSLFKGWKHPGRKCFFGFIRIDRGYNETEAVDAFRHEFRKHQRKTKGGGSLHWQAKLNDLVVMQLWGRFPKDPIKRVEHVAKFTTAGFKGCKDWSRDRRRGIKQKLVTGVDQRISDAAYEEMSRAQARALTFFQTLFPDEIPLSYVGRSLAATRKQIKTS